MVSVRASAPAVTHAAWRSVLVPAAPCGMGTAPPTDWSLEGSVISGELAVPASAGAARLSRRIAAKAKRRAAAIAWHRGVPMKRLPVLSGTQEEWYPWTVLLRRRTSPQPQSFRIQGQG